MRTLLMFTLLAYCSSSFSLEKATFAGGCFWCMEPPFEKLVGVKSVISGFSGGKIKNPSYQQVSSGKTQHIETIQISYDPQLVSYHRLLEIFWQQIDPTDANGQFVDRGHQYSSAIFYHNEDQKKIAQAMINDLNEKKIFSKKIVTALRQYESFYPAEDYHQDYYKKDLMSSVKYKYYRSRSGRDEFLAKTWKGKKYFYNQSSKFKRPSEEQLKKRLTKLQYAVTQEEATERPFDNEYWNHNKEGIYVDIVTGEPLFSSKDKYKSGTGWPSFTKPIDPQMIIEVEDKKLTSTRIEVRSRYGNSHLGHVFKDGPKPTGLRYCINSAALRFIPASK